MIKTKINFSCYSIIKNILLISIDSLAYVTSMFMAIYIRNTLPEFLYDIDFPGFSIQSYFLPETFIFLFIIILVFIWNSLYQKRRSFWEELLMIWKSLIITCLICYLFLFNFNELLPFMSRIVILLLFMCLVFILPLYRILLKKILFTISFWRTPVVLICKKEDLNKTIKIAHDFYKDFYLGFIPIGFLIEDDNLQQEVLFLDEKLVVYNNIKQIPSYATVFIIEDALAHDNQLISYLYSYYRKIYLVSYKNMIGTKGNYLFSERLFIITLENQLNSYLSQLIKFLMDRILSVIFLLLLCPLFFIIVVLLKILSPGPVFYCQERIGKSGKKFKIWKFRTMYVDAEQKLQQLLAKDLKLKKEWDTFFKLKNDPRIVPIGSFLRKYSLDELPQLFNVLNGTMSMVGPRPFVDGEIKSINATLLPLYAQVKPGLTGLWQISGRNEIDRLERMNIDVWYIQNWSPSLDLLILLNTPLAVLSAKGAS